MLHISKFKYVKQKNYILKHTPINQITQMK